jgi:hypothetical protein
MKTKGFFGHVFQPIFCSSSSKYTCQEDPVRIQVEFDENGVSMIESLKNRTGISTYKDLFNNALALLNWAVRQRESGRAVCSADESKKEYREIQMPALEYAARQKAA